MFLLLVVFVCFIYGSSANGRDHVILKFILDICYPITLIWFSVYENHNTSYTGVGGNTPESVAHLRIICCDILASKLKRCTSIKRTGIFYKICLTFITYLISRISNKNNFKTALKQQICMTYYFGQIRSAGETTF